MAELPFRFNPTYRRPAAMPGRASASARDLAVGAGHFYAWRTLEALGVDPRRGAVRASMVRYTAPEEVDRLLEALEAVLDG